jgi:hypothetical protein
MLCIGKFYSVLYIQQIHLTGSLIYIKSESKRTSNNNTSINYTCVQADERLSTADTAGPEDDRDELPLPMVRMGASSELHFQRGWSRTCRRSTWEQQRMRYGEAAAPVSGGRRGRDQGQRPERMKMAPIRAGPGPIPLEGRSGTTGRRRCPARRVSQQRRRDGASE